MAGSGLISRLVKRWATRQGRIPSASTNYVALLGVDPARVAVKYQGLDVLQEILRRASLWPRQVMIIEQEKQPNEVEGYRGMVARKDKIAIPDRYYLDRAHSWIVCRRKLRRLEKAEMQVSVPATVEHIGCL